MKHVLREGNRTTYLLAIKATKYDQSVDSPVSSMRFQQILWEDSKS